MDIFVVERFLSIMFQVVCQHKVIAVQVLRNIDCFFQGVAAFQLQRRLKTLDKVRLSLSAFVQYDAEILPIVDEVGKITILHKSGNPGKRAFGIKEGTFTVVFHLQLLKSNFNVTGFFFADLIVVGQADPDTFWLGSGAQLQPEAPIVVLLGQIDTVILGRAEVWLWADHIIIANK